MSTKMHRDPSMEMNPAIQEMLVEELKFLLAEVRTALSGLRTGIVLMTLPLSAMGLLLVTSSHHSLLAPPSFEIIAAFCFFLLLAGLWTIARALIRIRQFQRRIDDLLKMHPSLRSQDFG